MAGMNTKTSHDSETPAHGKQVITASAFIHHTNNGTEKLFLPKRADTKKFLPGVYELPGGHIDFGEDLVEGLKREIFEEFHMNISVGDAFYAFNYENKIKGSHSIEVIFFAEFIEPLEAIIINPEDHSGFVWASEAEVNTILEEKVKSDDREYKAILKGFELLNGIKPHFS
jgi:8-oxo-dGTP diphosphatase